MASTDLGQPAVSTIEHQKAFVGRPAVGSSGAGPLGVVPAWIYLLWSRISADLPAPEYRGELFGREGPPPAREAPPGSGPVHLRSFRRWGWTGARDFAASLQAPLSCGRRPRVAALDSAEADC